MAYISPAEQAVMAAMARSYDHEETRRALAAAVLRAATEHLLAEVPDNRSDQYDLGVEHSAEFLQRLADKLEPRP